MKHSSISSMNIFKERKAYEDLTISELCIIDQENISNGCGGKGGVSFDEILVLVERFDYFDKSLFEKFHKELKEQCKIHDYKYWIGGKWYHKLLADLVLSSWIFRNLQWTEWYITTTVSLWSLVGLTRKWNKYFNFL